jgi:hypothetical protein
MKISESYQGFRDFFEHIFPLNQCPIFKKYVPFMAHPILSSEKQLARKNKNPLPEEGRISREIFLSKLFSPLVPKSIFELT